MSLLDRPLEYAVKTQWGELVAFGLPPVQLQLFCLHDDPIWKSPNYQGTKPRFRLARLRLSNGQAVSGFKVECVN